MNSKKFDGKVVLVTGGTSGIGGESNPAGNYSIDGWQKVIDVNLNSVFYCMRYEIPQMIKQGSRWWIYGSIMSVLNKYRIMLIKQRRAVKNLWGDFYGRFRR